MVEGGAAPRGGGRLSVYRGVTRGNSLASRIMGPRYGMVMRAGGDILPVRMQLSEAPPQSRTGAPRFALVVEKCVTTEALVLVDEASGRVRSGTAGALDAMGVSPLQLRSETCRIQDVIKCF